MQARTSEEKIQIRAPPSIPASHHFTLVEENIRASIDFSSFANNTKPRPLQLQLLEIFPRSPPPQRYNRFLFYFCNNCLMYRCELHFREPASQEKLENQSKFPLLKNALTKTIHSSVPKFIIPESAFELTPYQEQKFSRSFPLIRKTFIRSLKDKEYIIAMEQIYKSQPFPCQVQPKHLQVLQLFIKRLSSFDPFFFIHFLVPCLFATCLRSAPQSPIVLSSKLLQEKIYEFAKTRNVFQITLNIPDLLSSQKPKLKEAPEYIPCNHEGLCTKDCPCIQKRGVCQQYCACAGICRFQYSGCSCRGPCKSASCACFVGQRQCSPSVCLCYKKTADVSDQIYQLSKSERRCRAIELLQDALLTTLPSSTTEKTCHNTPMTLGLDLPHLVYQASLIPHSGRGLYTTAKIKKDQFIGEYLGDLLDKIRGCQKSFLAKQTGGFYLFTREKDTIIDAEHYGSLARFANHKSLQESNAEFQIKFCSGNNRIGLFALRVIHPDQEIYVYYGESLPNSDWAD